MDLFFAALFIAAFARPGALELMLADGDTGWHIRTGQAVLATGAAPVADPFSFTRPGEPWFAWEWLADALFAAAHAAGGLAAVAALSGVVVCLAAALLFDWLLRRGVGLWLGAALTLAAASASTIHYLARPHVFSILLYTLALRLLDNDAEGRGRRLWLLVPLTALWANLHAGFVILPATLALSAAVGAVEGRRLTALRHGSAALLCLAASLANPYGWRLHQHILAYVTSPWIMDHVQEFQSPSIRSEGTVVFAALLLAGVACAWSAFARGDRFASVLTLLWAFAALRSARHIPFFAIVSARVVAVECAFHWRRYAGRASNRRPGAVLWSLAQDLGGAGRVTVWIPLTAIAALASAPAVAGFPGWRFPVDAVERQQQRLAPAHAMPRILTSDQWSDYLIYRLYPRQRVFFDGRSDFYGPRIGGDYRSLMAATGEWRDLLDRYGFELALLPHDWPLSTVLEREPGWKRVDRDRVAVLYARDRLPAAEGRP